MQNPLKIIYPDQCVCCGGLVEGTAGLCAACWSGTPFIDGLTCDSCGVPLLGDEADGIAHCDACMEKPPPWDHGRAVFAYRDTARRMVLSLKHGDRIDLAKPLAGWMAARGRPFCAKGTLAVPVPLHWTRLITRRFNQSALLATEIARIWGAETVPDALVRTRRTRAQEKMTGAERAANQTGAIAVSPRHREAIRGRPLVVIDDVMTSGATCIAAALALRDAGAASVSVLVLARVVKDF